MGGGSMRMGEGVAEVEVCCVVSQRVSELIKPTVKHIQSSENLLFGFSVQLLFATLISFVSVVSVQASVPTSVGFLLAVNQGLPLFYVQKVLVGARLHKRCHRVSELIHPSRTQNDPEMSRRPEPDQGI